MNIYISSSWKNREQVRELADKLRILGHYVFDFTDQDRRKCKICPPEKFPDQFDPSKHVYSQYLSRPEWMDVVFENKRAVDECDWVILLLPCGIDATADWAYGVGMLKASIVVGSPKKGERSPVHLWANEMVETIDEAIEIIQSNE